ncbi:MAG: hypothetical protein WC527_03835 [Candidatus Margulisiibacteriota bacterium]
MSDDLFDIVITSNSPGELYSLVRPAVRSLHRNIPNARIILVITPCQYASGREIEVARSFPEIYEIVFPQEFKNWVFRNKPPKGISFSKKGVVLFMGGDLMNGVILSRKLGYPAYAYAMDHIAWVKKYTKFFVPDKNIEQKALKKKVPAKKIKVVGDLMIDAVLCETVPKEPGKTVITLMPGSRPAHLQFLAPFFLKTADLIKEKNKEIKFVFGLSPYANALKLEEYISRGKMKKTELKEGAAGRLIVREDKKYILSEKGTEILIIEKDPYAAMAVADLIITIPGTNTAEAAAMGKPMLVTVPFNKPEAYIFDGLIGMIGNAPVIGRYIKRATISILNKAMKYIALPNRKAGEMIVPELRGNLKAEEIAAKAIELLSDPEKLVLTGKRLKKAMGAPGAADKISEEIAGLT